jgi:hypothetical protein
MRTRVVLTNGKISRQLLWLSHHGEDIYWGHGGEELKQKVSYHKNGRLHHQAGKRTIRIESQSPPAKIKGFEPILVVASICDPSKYSPEQSAKFSGSKCDAVFMIDSRSLPERGETQIHIGMIEAGRLDVLENLIRSGTQFIPGSSMSFKLLQTMLITSCSPWIFLSVQNLQLSPPEV